VKGSTRSLILAIDLGSTTFKAAVFDADLAQHGTGLRPPRYDCGPEGRVELDPSEVERSIGAVIRGAMDATGCSPADVSAIGLTSQAHTFTIMDRSGTVRSPFISWQDGRASQAAETLAANGDLRDFGEHCSFGSILASLQISQLRHIRSASPSLITPLDRVASLPAYLACQLSGRFVTDTNLAAMSGLYSLKLGDWWPPALRACNLMPSQLPRLVPVGTAAAMTTASALRYGLRDGIPVVLAGNDQTAGAYGAELNPGRDVLLTLGTALVAYRCFTELPPSRQAAARGPYPGGWSYRLTADGNGFALVDWAMSVLACPSYEAFYDLAESAAPGCAGVQFHAELAKNRGAWQNLGIRHTRADLARAVVEELCGRVTRLVGDLGVEIPAASFLVGGGGSRSPVCARMLSDALGAPLRLAPGGPLLGAAKMAGDFLHANEDRPPSTHSHRPVT
jgi:sugar (pentulose or hexulose) kinase